jgi:hypothetical protein
MMIGGMGGMETLSIANAGRAGSAVVPRTGTSRAGTGGTGGMGGTSAGAAAATVAGAGAGGNVAAAAGSGAAEGCTRKLLSDSVAAYFVALEAHDPASLPLAGSVKFTENGEAQELGKAGLWLTAGALRHAHSALDVDQCSAVAQAVVSDGGEDIPVALRLKLELQKIVEIETIAVRSGDFMLASNPDALIASAMSVRWEEPVPSEQRNTREELEAWIDKYFRLFPRGVCSTTSDCVRIENGGGSFDCSAGASCAATDPGPSDNALEPRLILADVETGLGIGFTMFQTNTDVHMFKMYGGKVYGVSAILGEADSSGWE